MGKVLTKNQIIANLAEEAGLQKKEIVKVIDCIHALALSELKANKEFKMFDLGKLKLKHRSARMVRNPATGKQIKVGAKNVVRFSASKQIKTKLM